MANLYGEVCRQCGSFWYWTEKGCLRCGYLGDLFGVAADDVDERFDLNGDDESEVEKS